MREAEAAFQLGDPDVRDELDLSPEQTERINRVLRPRGNGPGPHGPDMRRLMGDTTTRTELLTDLTAPQRQRLRQIFFQMRGPMAFNEPEVVEELHLTAAQRRQIKLIQAEWFASFGPPEDPSADPDRWSRWSGQSPSWWSRQSARSAREGWRSR